MERLVLVISILLGNPSDWVEFRVPMVSQKECHNMLLIKHIMLEKPTNIRFHCDIKRENDK